MQRQKDTIKHQASEATAISIRKAVGTIRLEQCKICTWEMVLHRCSMWEIVTNYRSLTVARSLQVGELANSARMQRPEIATAQYNISI